MAWKAKPQKDSFSSFFLGGRRIGQSLTFHTNWGLGFSFSNGFWFNVFLGYTSSLFVVYSGLLWSLSIIGVGLLLPFIRKATKNGDTIHGYIGSKFGLASQYVACIATAIGYIFNFGFEIYFSSEIFMNSIGLPELTLFLSIGLAIFSGLYCMIGGYAANTKTDKPQNYIGIVCAIILFVLLFYSTYYPQDGSEPLQSSAYFFSLPPLPVLIGLSTFLILFNSIDMANWQMIAANGDLSDEMTPGLKKAFYKSACLQYLMPSMIGCITGVFLSKVSGIQDNLLITEAINIAISQLPLYISYFISGLILFGLLSTTLSSGDTYLLALMHTLFIDLFKRKEYVSISKNHDDNMEEAYIKRLKPWMIFFALFSVMSFHFLYKNSPPGFIFQFQFIMYGTALALIPPIFYSFHKMRRNEKISSWMNGWTLLSIMGGVLASIIPYFYVLLHSNKDFSSYAPIFTLSISTAIFSTGLFSKYLLSKK